MIQKVLINEIDQEQHMYLDKTKKICKGRLTKEKNQLNLATFQRQSTIAPQKRQRKIKVQYKVFSSSQENPAEKQGKKCRKITGAKLGRPFREKKPKVSRQSEILTDPSIKMQQYLLQYFAEIGLTHGLTFRQEQRKFLSENQKTKIKWNETDRWNADIEKKKLESHERIQQMLRKCIPQAERRQVLLYSFISIGDFAAEQATQDIYITLAQIIQSSFLEESEEEQKERIKKLLRQLPFVSGKFTEQRKKYWLQIKDEETIEMKFGAIFKILKEKINDFLNSDGLQKTKKYFLGQGQLNKQLQEIIKKNRQPQRKENALQ